MRKLYFVCLMVLIACLSCQWHLRSGDEDGTEPFAIDRYDLIEQRYLKTGDFAVLQQLQTSYPTETRMLIEDVLKLGRVDDADINQRFLHFFQDSTLQVLMADVDSQYADLDDVNRELGKSFERLSRLLPGIAVPHVYTQIGSLDQSIIVGDGMLGISLDKYLGADHPVYLRYGYSDEQRNSMTRHFIVPDCIGFYLLSLYPQSDDATPEQRHWHNAKIQYVVNQVIGRHVFTLDAVSRVDSLMSSVNHPTIDQLLRSSNEMLGL